MINTLEHMNVVGYIGNKLELRVLDNGKSVITVILNVHHQRPIKNKETGTITYQKHRTSIVLEAFNHRAEYIHQYFTQGQKVHVQFQLYGKQMQTHDYKYLVNKCLITEIDGLEKKEQAMERHEAWVAKREREKTQKHEVTQQESNIEKASESVAVPVTQTEPTHEVNHPPQYEVDLFEEDDMEAIYAMNEKPQWAQPQIYDPKNKPDFTHYNVTDRLR